MLDGKCHGRESSEDFNRDQGGCVLLIVSVIHEFVMFTWSDHPSLMDVQQLSEECRCMILLYSYSD